MTPHTAGAQRHLLSATRPGLSRRGVLRAAFAGTLLPLIGCSVDTPASNSAPAAPTGPSGTPAPTASSSTGSGSRVLVAYFSRAGENYDNGGRTTLTVGNTEVVAGMIGQLMTCDTHRIEAADPYPDGYDATVARNVREQDADARPALANPLPGLAGYDTVLLGSPIWNVRPPMIMQTFADRHDFTGIRVLPFVTYAVSRLGSTERVYAQACRGADLGEALAVRGEQVGQARPDVEAWLRRARLLPA